MSIINENDIIIPNTIGIISAAVKEANRFVDQMHEHSNYSEIKNKNIAQYIREIPSIHGILQSRVDGIPLEELVDPERISNSEVRKTKKQEISSIRPYESWFNES